MPPVRGRTGTARRAMPAAGCQTSPAAPTAEQSTPVVAPTASAAGAPSAGRARTWPAPPQG
eukprot:scaffold13634_cov67-Phaeocystis_antarctica.AAC.3